MLSLPDYFVIGLYLIGTLSMGVAIGRRLKTGKDFFLAGRQLPWWAIGMSLVATDIGGTDIIGVGGAAYRHGMAVANFEWIGCVPAMIVGAFVFIPFFYRTGVYTIPEFMERRYNVAVRAILAACWLLFMACNLGIMLLASAKMMAQVFGWEPALCIIVTASLVGIYTMIGGLAAVVYTDMIQCVIMILGCLLILIMGLIEVGGFAELSHRLATLNHPMTDGAPLSPTEINASAESTADHASLILPVDTPSPYPWPGIFFGLALILSPAYWIGNQAIVQRSLGARSEFEAQASYIWGALLKNIIPLIVAVPGLIALVVVPDLQDSDGAIPALVGLMLPPGVRGIFVAAFLAALMSSIDSYLNSAATIVTNDFFVRFVNRQASDTQLLNIGRVTTLVLVAWAIVFAFSLNLLSDQGGIYAIFQTLLAFFQGPSFAVLIIGVFWRRATGTAAVIALLGGIGTSISLCVLNQPWLAEAWQLEPLFQIQEPFLYFSIWAFLVTAGLLIIISIFTKQVPAEKLQYVISNRNGRQDI
ncbi:MAG: sodium/solute symporter [Planctomycetales bacterium]|nr:sodium/solute symporter [Planctomycetales bacterium]